MGGERSLAENRNPHLDRAPLIRCHSKISPAPVATSSQQAKKLLLQLSQASPLERSVHPLSSLHLGCRICCPATSHTWRTYRCQGDRALYLGERSGDSFIMTLPRADADLLARQGLDALRGG